MAYRALYRQWRPVVFADVVGQNAVVKTLLRQITTGRIAHAYLFCGTKGTGKTTLAKIMSRAINCTNPKDGEPCGVCEVCRAILSESTLDVLELDAASNNSVDNVRDLLEQVRYPAQVGKYKVYIIDEVHMLSTAAFNALLKTLEEPPEHVVFILATTEPQRIPATILSRVQRFDIARIPATMIIDRMKPALADLDINAENEALQLIARAAEGSMRDAWSILDMAVSAAVNDKITLEIARDILGAADKEMIYQFTNALAHSDTKAVMEQIDKMIRAGNEPQRFLREVTQHLRSLLTVKIIDGDVTEILEIPKDDVERLKEQSDQFTQERLLRIMNDFMDADAGLRYASAPRLGVEIAALSACRQMNGEDLSALVERIAELEKKISQGIPLSLAADEQTSSKSTAKSENTMNHKMNREKIQKAEEQQDCQSSLKPERQAQEIWELALKKLAKSEPGTYGVLKREKFIGAVGTVYRVQVAQERKEFTFRLLTKQDTVSMINDALSDASGTSLTFEAVLQDEKLQKSNIQDNIQMLTETVGRDLLQIDESEV